MMALKLDRIPMVDILVECPRVDLTIRDKEDWSHVTRTIAGKKLGEC